MSNFSELIKNFDKTRDYMRDFFIYGFKTRTDFQYKSLRTYDNEKRRIESWLSDLIKFDSSKKGKQISLSVDSSRLSLNPLYQAHKSKSFTDNDILLHFYILDLLQKYQELSVEELTDKINECYGCLFEPQTVRIKLREYVAEGILLQEKRGKALSYRLSPEDAPSLCQSTDGLIDAITFFSECSPFGVVGNYMMDQINHKNDVFLYKHHFIVHTLEDHILHALLNSIERKQLIEIMNFGKSKRETILHCVPLMIYISTQTGRRYAMIYHPVAKRFNALRLDYIKSVTALSEYEQYDTLRTRFEHNAPFSWGVSFGNKDRYRPCENIKMILQIDEEKEPYIIDRLKREGRGGIITRLEPNTYSFTVDVFDSNEMMHWIKSFTGRISSLEGTNQTIISKFYRDMIRMKRLYKED